MTSSLTRRELDVMCALWRTGSATVREVHQNLADDLAYVTVLTVLRTLETKGHVTHVSEGKAYRYLPLTNASSAGMDALERIVACMYAGSRCDTVRALLSAPHVSRRDLEEIRSFVETRLSSTRQ